MSSSPRQLAGAAKGSPMEAPAISDSSEVGSQPATTPTALKGNWVRAVQGEQKGLVKYDVNVVIKDGVGSITVPDEVKDASPLWDEFIMGKFLDKTPHIAKVHAIVNKIWTMGDKAQMVEVYIINSNTMKFRVANTSTRKHILRRGMWNLAGVPVVMSNWSPFVEEDQPEEKSIPIWVHLKHVPMNMVSWKGLSLIASPVGVPVRLHPETAQCNNLKTPKIFVNADLTKELPQAMSFNLNGKETLVEYTYPWLPSRCSNCTKWGHLEKACLAPKKNSEQTNLEVEDGEVTPIESGNLEEKTDTQKDESPAAEQSKQNEGEQRLHTEGEAIGTEVNAVPKVTEKIHLVEKEINNSDELEWSDVSPGKASRSPKKRLEAEQFMTISRFSVLSQEEEREEVENTDHGDTEEVAESVEDYTATNTQIREREQNVVIKRQSLPRDSKDKHKFLSDSTAQRAKESPPALSKKSTRKHH